MGVNQQYKRPAEIRKICTASIRRKPVPTDRTSIGDDQQGFTICDVLSCVPDDTGGWRASTSSSHSSPRVNILRQGKTSTISHSKSGIDSLYLLQSGCVVAFVSALLPSGSVISGEPIPTSTSSNCGIVPNLRNICPIAYFSTRNRWACREEEILTVEVAVQTVLSAHWR